MGNYIDKSNIRTRWFEATGNEFPKDTSSIVMKSVPSAERYKAKIKRNEKAVAHCEKHGVVL